MTMILSLNTDFEGCTPLELVGRSIGYREVYRAIDGSGQMVTLTVYDLNVLPECFDGERIPEFEITPRLKNDMFAKYIDRGIYESGQIRLAWMKTAYVGGETLTVRLARAAAPAEHIALRQFCNLLVAVKELSWRQNGGSHNNLCTDNIVVTTNADGSEEWYLTGLNCISEPCHGRASFDTSAISLGSRAPETAVGVFGPKSDIFALGVMLAVILQGRHPWDSALGRIAESSLAATMKLFRSSAPRLDMSAPLRAIIGKAIAARPSARYRSIDEMGAAISGYLGDEGMTVFECFSHTPCNDVESSCMSSRQSDDMGSLSQRYTPSQPKATVEIARADGSGFKGVAGMAALKTRLTRDFIDILQNRELAAAFDIMPPNGILLWGPPGTGKTYISRKLAEESGLMFSLIKPSDLANIYLHGSQSMIADLFTRSEELAVRNKCGVLLVFDEFDSLVPRRGDNDDSHQASEVAEFLTRLNDCAEKNVFVVATTNRLDAIDSAIIRKGRIDEVIYVGMPDEEARRELIELELLKRPHEQVDTARIAAMTNGYSSSDLSFIVKECARCSFEASIRSNSIVKISQQMLESTVAATPPSVSPDELLRYERKHNSMRNAAGRFDRTPIGYRRR